MGDDVICFRYFFCCPDNVFPSCNTMHHRQPHLRRLRGHRTYGVPSQHQQKLVSARLWCGCGTAGAPTPLCCGKQTTTRR